MGWQSYRDWGHSMLEAHKVCFVALQAWYCLFTLQLLLYTGHQVWFSQNHSLDGCCKWALFEALSIGEGSPLLFIQVHVFVFKVVSSFLALRYLFSYSFILLAQGKPQIYPQHAHLTLPWNFRGHFRRYTVQTEAIALWLSGFLLALPMWTLEAAYLKINERYLNLTH